jgi:hypothetical protein
MTGFWCGEGGRIRRSIGHQRGAVPAVAAARWRISSKFSRELTGARRRLRLWALPARVRIGAIRRLAALDQPRSAAAERRRSHRGSVLIARDQNGFVLVRQTGFAAKARCLLARALGGLEKIRSVAVDATGEPPHAIRLTVTTPFGALRVSRNRRALTRILAIQFQTQHSAQTASQHGLRPQGPCVTQFRDAT